MHGSSNSVLIPFPILFLSGPQLCNFSPPVPKLNQLPWWFRLSVQWVDDGLDAFGSKDNDEDNKWKTFWKLLSHQRVENNWYHWMSYFKDNSCQLSTRIMGQIVHPSPYGLVWVGRHGGCDSEDYGTSWLYTDTSKTWSETSLAGPSFPSLASSPQKFQASKAVLIYSITHRLLNSDYHILSN